MTNPERMEVSWARRSRPHKADPSPDGGHHLGFRSGEAPAAAREGAGGLIVTGGGVALLRASEALDSLKLSGDDGVGVMIVRRALEEPIRLRDR